MGAAYYHRSTLFFCFYAVVHRVAHKVHYTLKLPFNETARLNTGRSGFESRLSTQK